MDFKFLTGILYSAFAMILIVYIAYRFASIFGHDADSMLHVWIGKEDIKAITKAARSAVWRNLYYSIILQFENLT